MSSPTQAPQSVPFLAPRWQSLAPDWWWAPPGDDTGALRAGTVYFYDLSTGTPTVPVVALNNPSPAISDEFGSSVAISGTRVAVGVPGYYTDRIRTSLGMRRSA